MSNAFTGWETDVLNAIGAPVTAANVSFLDQWHQFEQSAAADNPLNTTQPEAGASSINEDGVRSYINPAQGAQATATTLQNGLYPSLLSALKSGNPFDSSYTAGITHDLKTWGSSNYAAALTNGSVSASPAPTPTSGASPSASQETAAQATSSTGTASTGSGGVFGPIIDAITAASENAGLLAVALALIAGGFVWLAAPAAEDTAKTAAKVAPLVA